MSGDRPGRRLKSRAGLWPNDDDTLKRKPGCD
jgi:hypothetical protein